MRYLNLKSENSILFTLYLKLTRLCGNNFILSFSTPCTEKNITSTYLHASIFHCQTQLLRELVTTDSGLASYCLFSSSPHSRVLLVLTLPKKLLILFSQMTILAALSRLLCGVAMFTTVSRNFFNSNWRSTLWLLLLPLLAHVQYKTRHWR